VSRQTTSNTQPTRGEPSSPAERPSAGRYWWLVPVLVILLVHALSFRFIIDDAFITFRYARNLIDGHGLVFNVGDRVEGYSNFLWVLLSAVGMQLRLDPLLWTRFLGMFACAGVLLMLPRQVRVLAPKTATPQWAAPLLAALCGPIACWALAGLETPLFALLTVLAWRAATARRPLAAGVAGLALALTRPDGPLLAVSFLAWSLLPTGPQQVPAPKTGAARAPHDDEPTPAADGAPVWQRWVGPAVFVGGVLCHLLWRHTYYGEWLPNTYFAKTGDLAGQLRTGLPYGADFLRSYLAPVAGLLIWAGVTRGRRLLRHRELNYTLLVCLLWFGYTVVVGGDMLGMFRFYVPILPLVIVAAVAVYGSVTQTIAHADAGRPALWVMLVLGFFFLLPSTVGKERRLIGVHTSQQNLGGWLLAGDAMARVLPPGTTIALGPAGYIPYKTGFKTYDLYGITDRHIAHREMAFQQGYAGHEKHDGDYIIGRRPDYILLGNVDVTDQPRRGLIPPLNREVDIVQNQTFRQDYEMVNIPLADGKFLNCFKRKGAP